MTKYRLADLLDMTLVQKLADSNFLATGLPMRIVDADDLSMLIEAGWQDICKHFHRANPLSNRRCRQSDGEAKDNCGGEEICRYRCKNGLWHIAIPIHVAGRHMATMFLSQFYFEGEVPDREYFVGQAREFGYDLDSYLDALDRLPVFSVEKVSFISAYNKAFARFMADLAENSLKVLETGKSLRESEGKYRSLVNNVKIGIYRASSEGRFLQANPAFLNIFGYGSEEELSEIRIVDLYRDPDQRKPVIEELQRNGFVKDAVLALRKKDGTPIWCSVSVTAHYDEEGGMPWMDGAVEDVTERKKAAADLREQKEFSQNLLQNSAAPIFVLDREHRVLIWNRACEELTGVKAADMVGTDEAWKAFYDHRRPVLADLILDGNRDDLSLLYGVHSNSKFIPGGLQAERWWDNKGVARYIFFNAAPIRDGSGEIVAVIETLEDLTEMKLAENKLIEAEEALSESESKFRIIAEQALIGIFMHRDGYFKYVNPKFAEIFGYTVAECIDTMIFQEFIYPEDVAFVEDQIGRRLSGNPTSHYQFRGLTKEKGIVHLELYGSTTFYNKKPVSIGTLLDITDRKKAEAERRKLEEQFRQAQKMEAVGTLAGGIAHDFNNILMAMIGYCALIERETAEGSPIRSYLDKLVASTDRAATLTRSLLTYSRKQSLDAQPVDLNAVVKRVEDLLSRLLGEDVELVANLAGGPLTVIADSIQIEQVLMNLCTNARDAMPQGGVLEIATERVEMDPRSVKAAGFGIPGSYALMTVSDSGSGMDETTRRRIFEPFFTTKEVNKGTGLGLSIVFGIVVQHAGYIDVRSEPGGGTTFSIYLPLTGEAERTRPPTADKTRPVNGCETILLVEDDRNIRTIMKEILEGNGYAVIEAADGEDGIRRFEQFKEEIGLVILDMIMPKKNGKAAYEEMNAMRPGIRAIFLSGYSADILDAKGVLREDMNIIHKPVAINDLLLKIREVLDEAEY